jgi:hypothetical protein
MSKDSGCYIYSRDLSIVELELELELNCVVPVSSTSLRTTQIVPFGAGKTGMCSRCVQFCRTDRTATLAIAPMHDVIV